jgi:RimJ/RimL family protein N-acetyltransferase
MTSAFRSERLVYRAIEQNDEDNAFFYSLLSDTEGFGNYDIRLQKPFSRKESDKYAADHENRLLAVMICLPIPNSEGGEKGGEKLKPIGVVGLGGLPQWGLHHSHSGIFLFIEKGEQRKGYGGEAIEWVLKWAFETRGLHRVGIEYVGWSEETGKLYRRVGFRDEGRTREFLYRGGRWWDKVNLGMLDWEWREMQERKLEVREK